MYSMARTNVKQELFSRCVATLLIAHIQHLNGLIMVRFVSERLTLSVAIWTCLRRIMSAMKLLINVMHDWFHSPVMYYIAEKEQFWASPVLFPMIFLFAWVSG